METPRFSPPECKNCHVKYTEDVENRVPIILPQCGHTVCRECANKLWRSRRIVCPFDRSESQVNELSALRTNYSMLDLEKCVECQICLQTYSGSISSRHPVILPQCGHTVCRECVYKLREVGEGCNVVCPFDRSSVLMINPEQLLKRDVSLLEMMGKCSGEVANSPPFEVIVCAPPLAPPPFPIRDIFPAVRNVVQVVNREDESDHDDDEVGIVERMNHLMGRSYELAFDAYRDDVHDVYEVDDAFGGRLGDDSEEDDDETSEDEVVNNVHGRYLTDSDGDEDEDENQDDEDDASEDNDEDNDDGDDDDEDDDDSEDNDDGDDENDDASQDDEVDNGRGRYLIDSDDDEGEDDDDDDEYDDDEDDASEGNDDDGRDDVSYDDDNDDEDDDDDNGEDDYASQDDEEDNVRGRYFPDGDGDEDEGDDAADDASEDNNHVHCEYNEDYDNDDDGIHDNRYDDPYDNNFDSGQNDDNSDDGYYY